MVYEVHMIHSYKATDLVMGSEGCDLTTYPDGNKILTIGYGHTGSFATEGNTISKEQAITLLNGDMAMTDQAVNRLVRVRINQNQFDALVSLTFNIGQGHFSTSSCLSLLNKGDYSGAAEHILLWNKVAGKVSDGLVTRRLKEKALFESK